jgi:hypothetical protein
MFPSSRLIEVNVVEVVNVQSNSFVTNSVGPQYLFVITVKVYFEK